MEICQSCLTSFDDDIVQTVQFSIWEKVDRQWYLCPDCTAKLQDMVLGFMGEQEPADAGTWPGARWNPAAWRAASYEALLENLAAKISKYEAKLTLTEMANVIENTASDYDDICEAVRVLRKLARQEMNTMNNK